MHYENLAQIADGAQMPADVPPMQTVQLGHLRRALEERRLDVMYQPIVSLGNGRVVGAEALAYWEDPVRGVISPDVFIALAEEGDLIDALGEWVLDNAVQLLVALRQAEAPDISVAVNVSSLQFRRDGGLRTAVERVLDKHACRGDGLALEITESAPIDCPDSARRTMKALADRGVAWALDDFGAGYASFSRLKHFSFDCLKLDSSLVAHLGEEPLAYAMVRDLVELGHKLGLRVVAEGVEREIQADLLRKARCCHAQGYLFGRPMRSGVFLRHADRRQAGQGALAPIRA